MEEDKKQSAETANPHSTKNKPWSETLKEMGIDEEEDKEIPNYEPQKIKVQDPS